MCMDKLAHAGHEHSTDMNMMTADHCMPLIVGAGIIIVVLLGVIFYLLRESNSQKPAKKTKSSKK